MLVSQLLFQIVLLFDNLVEFADLCLHFKVRLHEGLDLDVLLHAAVVQLVPFFLQLGQVVSNALCKLLILRSERACISLDLIDLSCQNGSLILFFLQNRLILVSLDFDVSCSFNHVLKVLDLAVLDRDKSLNVTFFVLKGHYELFKLLDCGLELFLVV